MIKFFRDYVILMNVKENVLVEDIVKKKFSDGEEKDVF